MNKPSERIVVFVTPAQKRAISATAEELGISVSELMRRAVTAFSATSDQVKAASIVDRLNAPREPDALAQVLRKAAKPLRPGRGFALRMAEAAEPDETADTAAGRADTGAAPAPAADAPHAAGAGRQTGGGDDRAESPAPQPASAAPSDTPVVPRGHGARAGRGGGPPAATSLAAGPEIGHAPREVAQAIARLSTEAGEPGAASVDASQPGAANADRHANEPPQASSATPFARTPRAARREGAGNAGNTDERHSGPTGEDGKFA